MTDEQKARLAELVERYRSRDGQMVILETHELVQLLIQERTQNNLWVDKIAVLLTAYVRRHGVQTPHGTRELRVEQRDVAAIPHGVMAWPRVDHARREMVLEVPST